MVLIAGIVGISGMVILKNDIGNLSDGYREITYEYSENKRYTLEIRTLLYKQGRLVMPLTIVSRSSCKSVPSGFRAAIVVPKTFVGVQ